MSKYVAGNILFRSLDNKLFIVKEVIHNRIYVLMDPLNLCPQPQIQYINVSAIDNQACCDDKLFSSSVPEMPIVGQHVWRKGTGTHFKVKKINDNFKDNAFDPKGPCNKCFHGKCEQCQWGYRDPDDVMVEYKEMWQPYNRYDITVLSLDGKTQFKMNTVVFNNDYTMIPPNISRLTKNILEYTYDFERKKQYENIVALVEYEMKTLEGGIGVIDSGFNEIPLEKDVEKAEREVDDVMNDNLEKESIDTGTTVDDSYDTWRNNLKVVNVAKFDQTYFQRGLAYHVQKRGFGDYEFNGIMVSVDENTLKVLRLGTHISYDYENDTEIVFIPLKEYMDGLWHIVRLVEEENK